METRKQRITAPQTRTNPILSKDQVCVCSLYDFLSLWTSKWPITSPLKNNPSNFHICYWMFLSILLCLAIALAELSSMIIVSCSQVIAASRRDYVENQSSLVFKGIRIPRPSCDAGRMHHGCQKRSTWPPPPSTHTQRLKITQPRFGVHGFPRQWREQDQRCCGGQFYLVGDNLRPGRAAWFLVNIFCRIATLPGRKVPTASGRTALHPPCLFTLLAHNTHSQNAGMIAAIISPRAHPPTCQMKDRWRTFYRTKKKRLTQPSLISKRRQKMAEEKCWICPCGWRAPDIVNHLQFTAHRTTMLLNSILFCWWQAKTSGTGRPRMRQPGAIRPAWPKLEINPIYLRPEKSAELPKVQNAFRSQCTVKEVWT